MWWSNGEERRDHFAVEKLEFVRNNLGWKWVVEVDNMSPRNRGSDLEILSYMCKSEKTILPFKGNKLTM